MRTKHYTRRNVALVAALIGASLTIVHAVRADDSAATASTESSTPQIHPEADRLFRAMCERVGGAKELSFKAEVWEDEDILGHKVSRTKLVDVRLRRPDRLQIESRSQTLNRGWWYDGKSLTLLGRDTNLYGTIAVPDTINKFLDAANEKYGINFPLEDLLLNDPYASATAAIKGGAYLGKASILGTPCQHIAFSTDEVDWQLWIEDGRNPLPRKLVITYKLQDTQPQYTAIFSDWNLKAHFTDKTFEFTPPKGALKIEVVPVPADDQSQPNQP